MTKRKFTQKRKKKMPKYQNSQFTKIIILNSLEEYHELMNTLNPPPVEGKDPPEHVVADELIDKTQAKTMRFLRHRELLLEYSSASSVVLMWAKIGQFIKIA